GLQGQRNSCADSVVVRPALSRIRGCAPQRGVEGIKNESPPKPEAVRATKSDPQGHVENHETPKAYPPGTCMRTTSRVYKLTHPDGQTKEQMETAPDCQKAIDAMAARPGRFGS